ncbi:MAG: PIN domain-containing protein [Chthoniobacterales bacterium]
MRKGLDPAETLTQTVSLTDLATCGMVRLEVLRGVKNPRVRDKLSSFFDVLQNVPTDNRLWEEAASLAWKLDRVGRVLPAQDILIAASAMRVGAVVLTADAHFQNIPGLRVNKWVD